MRKYVEILRTTIEEYFAYRLNFVLWRLRMVLNLFLIYFLWNSIFEGEGSLFGYSREQMLTYILLNFLVSNFVLGTRTVDVAGQIVRGDIINYILKPISFFKYYLTRDLADKLLNFSFALFEISLIFVFFKPQIFFQKDPLVFLYFVVFGLLGTFISFFISLSLSFIGFWTSEVWAPRFIYFILVFFLSGSYFPLDILPKPIYYLLLLTPFPYLYYLSSIIYLKGLTGSLAFEISVSLVWVFLSYKLARFLWNRGLTTYSFFGR